MLNRDLYRKLCGVFGKNGVGIHRAGEGGAFKKELVGNGSYKKARLSKTQGLSPGEEFSIRCPFCNDHNPRLYLNHRWGTKDPYSGRRILWLMHCYNEECQTDYQNRVALARMVFDGEDDQAQILDVEPDELPREPKKVVLPGAMQSIEVLAQTQLDHPAVQWCMARQLDIHELTHRYGVGYCGLATYANSPNAQRLVVPFYTRVNGVVELVGWTARILRKPEPGEAKWRHSSSATGQIVYGLGEASAYQTIVVGEGPGDKYAVGRPGVAMLGKSPNEFKLRRIAAAVNNDPRRVIVVLLDPTQDKVAKAKRLEHHSAVATKLLREMTKTPVIDVRLPPTSDPGSLDHQYIWRYIMREAKGQGLSVKYARVF